MKRTAILWVMLVAALGPLQAWGHADPAGARGVYAGGQFHYISLTRDQTVAHYQKMIVPGDWECNWDDPSDQLPLDKGWKRQDPDRYCQGEGVVVAGSLMIHYAVALNASGAPQLIVSRYDLVNGKFLPDASGKMVPTPLAALSKNGVGTYGVAATIANNKIYVFTSEFTLVNSDGAGLSYSRLAAIADGLDSHNPLDAITFYPTDAPPKVMVLFGYVAKSYDPRGANYVTWNGSDSFPLPPSSVTGFANGSYLSGGALFLGTVGPGNNHFPPGAKVPCVQVVTYGQSPYFSVSTFEYRIPSGTLTSMGSQNPLEPDAPINRIRVFPWYLQQVDSKSRPVLKQYFVLNWLECTGASCIGHRKVSIGLNSDYLVPQNEDANGEYGWQGMPTACGSGDDAAEEAVRRKYWSLAGVILGPPPFAINGIADPTSLSNVVYGQSQTATIAHTQTWSNSAMAGSEDTLRLGYRNTNEIGLNSCTDISFSHGWFGSQTATTSCSAGIFATCGTQDQSMGNWGTDGWAIFNIPTLVVQVNQDYAYDYDLQSSSGTYMGLDFPSVAQAQQADATKPVPLQVAAVRFKLQDPGGPEDDYPGAMAGMSAYPPSTDLASWGVMDWEAAGAPWKVIYGTGNGGGAMVPAVRLGTESHMPFSTVTTDIQTTGTTASVSLDESVGIYDKFMLKGMSKTMTAGYDGSWSSQTTASTAVSQNLIIGYHVPSMPATCTASDCVQSITVQPYLLVATGNAAPWIPTDFSANLPWCIAWEVTKVCLADGTCGGLSSPPKSAGGTIVGGSGASEIGVPESASKWSDYTLTDGSMSWLEEGGQETPIPLTADTFDPALGASIFLSQWEFPAAGGAGAWKRDGNVWQFKNGGGSGQETYKLKLDFGKGTWTFEGSRLSLGDHILAGQSSCRAELRVNGRYSFSCVIRHKAKVAWSLKRSPTSPSAMELTSYSGLVGASREANTVKLEGTVPADIPGFGDVGLLINGRRTEVPLVTEKEFADALEHRGKVVYEKGGVHLKVDFKTNRWSATIQGKAIEALMGPLMGQAGITVTVGGAPWFSQRVAISDFVAKLHFKR